MSSLTLCKDMPPLTDEIDVHTMLVGELLVDRDLQSVVFVIGIVRIIEFIVLLHVGDQLEVELSLALFRVHRGEVAVKSL